MSESVVLTQANGARQEQGNVFGGNLDGIDQYTTFQPLNATAKEPLTENQLVDLLVVDAVVARLVASDIDDTLVCNGGKQVSPAVQSAVEACRTVDVSVSVITGRSIARTLPIIRSLGGFGIHVVANGAVIIDSLGNIIDQHDLEEATVVSVAKVIRTYNRSQSDEDALPIYLPGSKCGVSPQDLSPQAAQTLYVPLSAAQEEPFQAVLNSEFGNSLSIYSSDSPPFVMEGRRMLNIGSPKATKEAGLRRLLELYESNPEDIVALGDGVNDIPLFNVAGTSIAVANGDQQLLQRADYIVPSQREGGAVLAIRSIVRAIKLQLPYLYGNQQ